MPDRTAEEIRFEIAAERQRLVDDVASLRKEARTFIPIAIAAVVGLAVVARYHASSRAVKLLWRLR
jgi:hypothetical protein